MTLQLINTTVNTMQQASKD